MADTYGDTPGAWTFTLTVTAGTITQTAPTTATTPTVTSSTFTSQLNVKGNLGTVTYTETTSADSSDVVVSSTGAVTTKGALAAGTYAVSGTVTDPYGDSGTWTFTLTVTASTITQVTPKTATVPVATSTAFSDQLKVSGSPGTVTYTTTTPTPTGHLTVSSTGAITTKGTLAAGTYAAKGTMADAYGDTPGAWTFTLTVTPGTITQTTPTSAAVKLTQLAGFTAQLAVTGNIGAVTYTEASSPDSGDVLVSSTGQVTAKSTLAVGTYTVSGTVSDSYGDTGTWGFSLQVKHLSPGVTSVSPVAGPLAGGTVVTITGANFATGLSVSFGTVLGTTVHVTSSTTLTVHSPARATPATVTVIVFYAQTNLASGGGVTFTYDPVPTVTKVTPSSGPTGGGTAVTLTGTGFVAGATTVTFGGVAGTTVHVTSATKLTVKSPSHPSGTVTVLVTTPGGTSAAGEHFTY